MANFMREFAIMAGALLLSSVAAMLFQSWYEEISGNKKHRSIAFQKFLEMGIPLNDFHLSKHELAVASMAVVPSSIDVGWTDIGGLDSEIQTLRETVIMPIANSKVFTGSKLLSIPKGVLLSGPPGCGKTLMAKAIAKESGCIFINVDISVVLDMYVGESPKYVSALFSFAEKLSVYCPVILFVDEVDLLLGQRTSRDHESSQQVKSIFMTSWDGLISDKDTRIVVIGATNLPNVLDAAVYRRLPIRFNFNYPKKSARLQILRVLLRDEVLSPGVDLGTLSSATDDMSGSDIKEYCSQSCMVRYREMFREQIKHGTPTNENECQFQQQNIRPVNMSDFITASTLFNNEKLRNFFSGYHELVPDAVD